MTKKYSENKHSPLNLVLWDVEGEAFTSVAAELLKQILDS